MDLGEATTAWVWILSISSRKLKGSLAILAVVALIPPVAVVGVRGNATRSAQTRRVTQVTSVFLRVTPPPSVTPKLFAFDVHQRTHDQGYGP